MLRKIIPDIVSEQSIHDMPETATALEAATLMRENRIGAVVVTDNGVLKGIVTERDLAWRVLAEGKDPNATPLSEIMTRNPDTLSPDDQAFSALDLMNERKYRHLPVVQDGKVVGMCSVRDLYGAVRISLEEDLQSCEAFIFGEPYKAANA